MEVFRDADVRRDEKKGGFRLYQGYPLEEDLYVEKCKLSRAGKEVLL